MSVYNTVNTYFLGPSYLICPNIHLPIQADSKTRRSALTCILLTVLNCPRKLGEYLKTRSIW